MLLVNLKLLNKKIKYDIIEINGGWFCMVFFKSTFNVLLRNNGPCQEYPSRAKQFLMLLQAVREAVFRALDNLINFFTSNQTKPVCRDTDRYFFVTRNHEIRILKNPDNVPPPPPSPQSVRKV